MRVHAIEVGRIGWPVGWWDAVSPMDAVRSIMRGAGGPEEEIPIISYVIEHDDGHIVIDCGFDLRSAQDFQRERLPRTLGLSLILTEDDVIGPQMRKRGLDPLDVKWVLPTHLDMDHAGGVSAFPNATFLVNRREWEFRKTTLGKIRFRERYWPDFFRPLVYDLRDEPVGPFTRASRSPTAAISSPCRHLGTRRITSGSSSGRPPCICSSAAIT
jgi:glyoxylase-like metal-dependent hydrolase (beta-lactamase superfamily II)